MGFFNIEAAQKRVTTTVDKADFEFLKKRNIKFAHAIRDFCNRRRQVDSGAYEETIENLRAARDRAVGTNKKVFEELNKILTPEQIDALVKNI